MSILISILILKLMFELVLILILKVKYVLILMLIVKYTQLIVMCWLFQLMLRSRDLTTSEFVATSPLQTPQLK